MGTYIADGYLSTVGHREALNRPGASSLSLSLSLSTVRMFSRHSGTIQ